MDQNRQNCYVLKGAYLFTNPPLCISQTADNHFRNHSIVSLQEPGGRERQREPCAVGPLREELMQLNVDGVLFSFSPLFDSASTVRSKLRKKSVEKRREGRLSLWFNYFNYHPSQLS